MHLLGRTVMVVGIAVVGEGCSPDAPGESHDSYDGGARAIRDAAPAIWSDRTWSPGDATAPSTSDAPTVVSPNSPATAKFVYASDGPSGGLAIVASNLLVSSGDHPLARWIVVVHNDGPSPICFVGINADMKSASADVLLSFRMNVNGSVQTWQDRALNCVGADETGVGLGVDQLTAPLDPAMIATVEYSFAGNITPEAKPAAFATVTGVSAQVSPLSSDAFIVSGQVVAGTKPLKYLFVYAYPQNPSGMPLEELAISNATLSAGASWDFKTTSFGARFDKYYFIFQYTF